jgi:hypothetical protein
MKTVQNCTDKPGAIARERVAHGIGDLFGSLARIDEINELESQSLMAESLRPRSPINRAPCLYRAAASCFSMLMLPEPTAIRFDAKTRTTFDGWLQASPPALLCPA